MENENCGDLIRANIKEILREKKMTMVEAEKIIGKPKALSNFMCGRQASPSATSLFAFAKALNVPLHRIFGEKVEDVELNAKSMPILVHVLPILARLFVRLSNNEDFLKKQHSLSKIAKMVLALQKMTEATQADEVDLAFLEEFLLKL